jgi:hypothetical protein
LRRLIDDPELRASLGLEAEAYAREKFDATHNAALVEEVYARLLRGEHAAVPLEPVVAAALYR